MAQNGTAIRLKFENLRSLAFGSISGVYAAVGTPLANPSRKLTIQNYTDGEIIFSQDGTNDAFALAAGASAIFDFRLGLEGDYFAQGTTFYAKGTPTSGNVYISTIYGAI